MVIPAFEKSPTSSCGPVRLQHLGRLGYREALLWQSAVAGGVRRGEVAEALALLEHFPVYTLGLRGRREHFLLDEAELARRGAEVVTTDRGGEVTFHGPGQLVAYPVLNLRRRGIGPIHYVGGLEDAAIAALERFGVAGERRPRCRGVWAGGAKVAAVGVRIAGGVCTHGIAINVGVDLSWFDWIVPCGMVGGRVTSLEKLLGRSVDVDDVAGVFARALASILRLDLVEAEAARALTGVAAGDG